MIDIEKLSDASLKELYEIMYSRKNSCTQNPQEEEVYQTQSNDWQTIFSRIESELKRRGLI